jgi:hypothetical protein
MWRTCDLHTKGGCTDMRSGAHCCPDSIRERLDNEVFATMAIQG